jgi:hypothetical protein
MPMRPRSGMLAATAAVLLVALSFEARGDDPKPPVGRAYSLTSDADVSISTADPQQPPVQLTTWTRIDYALDRKPEALDVLLHSMSLTIKRDGRVMNKSAISRKLFREMPQPGADTVDVPYENGPPALRTMLQVFDVPIVTVTLDANGRELGRKPRIEGEDVKSLVNTTESILSLHRPFVTGSTSWDTPVSLSAGQNQTVKGTLKFEKTGQSEEGLVTVKVSGELPLTGTIAGSQLKNGRYVVSGEQLYDPSVQEWKSGKWNMTVAAEMVNPGNDKPVGSMRGTMVLQMGAPETIRTPVDALRIEPGRSKVRR